MTIHTTSRRMVKARAVKIGAGITGALGAIVFMAAPSWAVGTLSSDPLGGAENGPITSVKQWVTQYGAPLVFALLAIGLIIVLAVKFVKRGARSA